MAYRRHKGLQFAFWAIWACSAPYHGVASRKAGKNEIAVDEPFANMTIQWPKGEAGTELSFVMADFGTIPYGHNIQCAPSAFRACAHGRRRWHRFVWRLCCKCCEAPARPVYSNLAVSWLTLSVCVLGRCVPLERSRLHSFVRCVAFAEAVTLTGAGFNR